MNPRDLTTTLVLCGFLLYAASPARAQKIPPNIPDGSDESPADRQRALLTERHRSLISQLFTGSSAAIAPPVNTTYAAYSVQMEGGLDLPHGSAMYGTVGVRQFPLQNDGAGAGRQRRARQAAVTVGLGFDLGLEHLMDATAFARRSALGLSVGRTFGEVDALSLELNPKYTLPINAYWSLPVGLKLGRAFLGFEDRSLQRTFVGVSIGVKLHHYGYRDELE